MGLPKEKGDALITIIIAMLMVGVFGAGIYSLTTSSTFGELLSNRNDNAYDLARAGVRYGVSVQLANYPETTFYMPDSKSTFKIKIENYIITSTGIVNPGTSLEARRVIVYDLAVSWGSGGGEPLPPPPTEPVIDSNTEFPSFSEPVASGESGGSAVQTDPDTNTVTLGGGVTDSYGSLWYQGSSNVGYCIDGVCNFGSGIRAYFEFAFLNEDYSANSTANADGFTFAVMSAINNTRDRTGGAVGQGELMGYAGAGSTADGLGLKPPKMAIEFDTYPNGGTSDLCSAGSRNDPNYTPNNFRNHAAIMFWGARTLSGTCDGKARGSYDDNRHSAGGSDGNPQNAGSTAGSGYYEGAKETCKSSSNTCNWMESGYPYVCRLEVVRPSSPSGGLYNYEIKAWVVRLDSLTDTLVKGRFQDIIVPYTDTAYQISRTVSLSETDHNDFSKIFFGFTEATGSSAQEITLANFKFFFPQGDCTYAIAPSNAAPGAAEGTGSLNVTAVTSCPWIASSLATWIEISSGGVGAGNGTVGYKVHENDGPARTGWINIAGQTFTVNQADGCAYLLSAYIQSFGRYAGTGTVTVESGTGCTWTATSNNSWISITSGSSGSGPGTVGYSVSTNNTGAPRTGTMTIAGQTFTVNQAAQPTCTLVANPNIVPYGGTTGLTWTITNGPANGSFSPSPGGACTNFSNSSGGTCTTGSQTTAGDRTYTLTVSNTNGSSTCSATVYTGCSEYRVWNNTGSRRDFRVTGSGCRRVNNGSEITTTTYRLNSGETVTRYNTNNGTCGSAQGSINYTDAMNVDIEISGGNGNCRVNYNSGDTVSDR